MNDREAIDIDRLRKYRSRPRRRGAYRPDSTVGTEVAADDVAMLAGLIREYDRDISKAPVIRRALEALEDMRR